MRWLAVLSLLLASCMNDPAPSARHAAAASAVPRPERDRVKAAAVFTDRYAHSRLSGWNVRGIAAGPQCDVLMVNVGTILDDARVEGMHYGTSPYDVYQGGVHRFSLRRGFTGVAYQDETRRIWTYGEVTVPRAEILEPCQ